MSDKTKIEWADATWTPIKGCTRKSPGCVNCYAEIMAARFSKPGQWGEGLSTIVQTNEGKDHRWTGLVRLDDNELLKPLHWTKPRNIFVCSTSDLFHEDVTEEDIDLVFAVMERARQHTYMVLTKRAERMRDYITARTRLPDNIAAFYDLPTDGSAKLYQPFSNVWFGVSVEDQTRADERIEALRETPALVRFISFEPLLGAITANLTGIHWAIVGGESGPGSRPMHPDWARSLRDQCASANVPFFFKQWGEWRDGGGHVPIPVRNYQSHICYLDKDTGKCKSNPNRFSDETMIKLGKGKSGRLLDGVEHNGFPGGVN